MSRARIAIAWLVTTALLVGAGITTAVLADAAVTLYTATTSVRVRTGPSTSKSILHMLQKGDVVEGKGKATNGWQPVSFNDTTAYVWAQYVKATTATKTPITTAAPSTRTTSAEVNLRTAASLNSTVIRVLTKGTAVAATGRESGDFTEVTVDGKLRWLFTDYVGGTTTAATTESATTATAATTTTSDLPETVATVITSGDVTLRQEASNFATSLGIVAAATEVGLTGQHSGSYSQIVTAGKLGWVLTGYLRPSDKSPTVTLPVSTGRRYINATSVNVRKAADAESTKLATLALGAVLQLTGPTMNSFTQVIFDGGLAWVASKYLSATKPTTSVSSTSASSTSVSSTSASSTSASSTSLGSTSLDKLKANGKAAVLVVRDKFPQIKTIYGWRSSSAYSSDHPNGRAIDIMIPSYKKNKALGDEIAQYFIDNAKSLKVKYVIWRQRSYTITRGKWVHMSDRGGDTANHYDHVHVSFLS